jgi:DNA-directed RNA polymerase subunit E'/Rpb7
MLKAVKNYHYNTEQKTLQHPGRHNLEEFVFDAFMPVFCVLTMEIMEGVVSYVTDEGVRVHGASHEEFVCEVVDKLAD